nr:MAG TPA: hypothetical protein [Caudoviricetes sp.]
MNCNYMCFIFKCRYTSILDFSTTSSSNTITTF